MAVILLTDANQRATLAACRSLVRAGHQVHVVGDRRWSLAGVSRGVRHHLVNVDPLAAPEAFAAAARALAQQLRADLLLPMTDASATAVLSHGPQAEPYRIPMPGLAAFRLASDKAALLPLAAQAGLAIPESVVVPTAAAALGQSLEGLAPGVLKPHRSIAVVDGGLRRQGVMRYSTAAEGSALLRALPPEAFPILAQRRVEGPGVGYFALRWAGSLVATFAHRRVREVPPSGGVSVCRESLPMPASLAEAGARLLAALDWEGVAMVECKHDPLTDRYYVMEINPRFWGSLQLAVDAGVDFPKLLVECALGGSPPPVTNYRAGIRSRWGWGEVDFIYLSTKLRPQGRGALAALLRAVGEVLPWSLRRDRAEILRWSDPLPAVVETLERFGIA